MLEKVVQEANGAVRLVKIDVDRNPMIAGQLRVQSIPTVYAFVDGRPVDTFQGALPESKIRAFVQKLAGEAANSPVDDATEQGTAAAEALSAHGAAEQRPAVRTEERRVGKAGARPGKSRW